MARRHRHPGHGPAHTPPLGLGSNSGLTFGASLPQLDISTPADHAAPGFRGCVHHVLKPDHAAKLHSDTTPGHASKSRTNTTPSRVPEPGPVASARSFDGRVFGTDREHPRG
ncbi:hypothetical protein FE391_15880 [Nonomuraea sp. KC401]|uniref:hypothetical protein n=1 Tax=unclassified Nonomuraea TaxID=2593643 RepID=UPI0010FF61D2|nr:MULTISPECIES: hypothetical protein [unclassified Nonomuraea]NBE92791.1 hypothetical protein [Nonomuraea sp. K271]TLF73012.1 hypothetical protein FE391_15880 [Nonomuraea sp. KC401]